MSGGRPPRVSRTSVSFSGRSGDEDHSDWESTENSSLEGDDRHPRGVGVMDVRHQHMDPSGSNVNIDDETASGLFHVASDVGGDNNNGSGSDVGDVPEHWRGDLVKQWASCRTINMGCDDDDDDDDEDEGEEEGGGGEGGDEEGGGLDLSSALAAPSLDRGGSSSGSSRNMPANARRISVDSSVGLDSLDITREFLRGNLNASFRVIGGTNSGIEAEAREAGLNLSIRSVESSGSGAIWDRMETKSKSDRKRMEAANHKLSKIMANPLTESKRMKQERRRLYLRRCAKAMAIFVALAVMSVSAVYLVAEESHKSMSEIVSSWSGLFDSETDEEDNHPRYRKLPENFHCNDIVHTLWLSPEEGGLIDFYQREGELSERDRRQRARVEREHCRMQARRERLAGDSGWNEPRAVRWLTNGPKEWDHGWEGIAYEGWTDP